MPRQRFSYKKAALKICIDTRVDGRISGRVYSERLKTPIHFGDLNEFLVSAERVFDIQQFPQAFQRLRDYNHSNKAEDESKYNDESIPYLDEGVVSSASGQMATLVINILTRQNSTWQGYIDWLDGEGQKEFQSDLELITTIDAKVSMLDNNA